MIIQRDAPFKIYADVTVNFLGKTYKSAPVNGGHICTLAPVGAGGPFSMEIISDNGSLTLEDIYSGDLWLCAGQSNMELQMERLKDDFPQEWELNYPLIRQFKLDQEYYFTGPRDEANGYWLKAVSENLHEFSGTAWFFAKEMYKKYGIPIGIVNAAWGGTPVESWMSEDALINFPEKLALAEKYADAEKRDFIMAENNAQILAWETGTKKEDKGLSDKWDERQTDISSWDDIKLPGDFSEAGIKGFCGVIWIARDVDVPAALAEGESRLWLGTIVDSDTVFINGVQVGTTDYRYPPRKYGIEKGVLKPGVNRITLRVSCWDGEGGVTPDKPFRLFSDEAVVELAGTWKYKVGMTAASRPKEFFFQWQPVGNFNAMIAPVLKYPLKGVLWYQGESNDTEPENYGTLLTAMIKDWRKKNNNDNLPFIAVQLPIWGIEEENNINSSWAILREAQASILELPNTAIAAALDLGEWNDLHPINKKDAGYRLFLAADKLLNGAFNSSPGPAVCGYSVKNRKLVITFNNCAGGLTAEETIYVSIGADGGYKRLPAQITGTDSVVIDLSGVKNPQSVLYAYAKNPKDRQLYNSDKLPALPFRLNIQMPYMANKGENMFDAKEQKEKIIQWIRDYFEENGKDCNAVIGVSGGKDSSTTAALCVEALGKDKVYAVLLPQGRQHDINVSRDLVEHLGIQHIIINIKDTVDTLVTTIRESDCELNRQARINIPARIRMTTLYAISASINGRVANTCNLSEDYVGYATKFGDGAGDFSPLANLTVSEVKALGRELGLPSKFIDKVPEDGLSGLSDEENLGFSYEALDRYIREGVCEDAAVKEKIDALHKQNLHKLNLIPSYKPGS